MKVSFTKLVNTQMFQDQGNFKTTITTRSYKQVLNNTTTVSGRNEVKIIDINMDDLFLRF